MGSTPIHPRLNFVDHVIELILWLSGYQPGKELVKVTINLPDDLVKRLQKAAQRHNLPVEVFLESLLEQVDPPEKSEASGGEAPPGTLAALAAAALRADLHLGVQDVSARSREILNNEWGDYLARRMDRKVDDTNG